MATSKVGTKYTVGTKVSIPIGQNFTLPCDGHVFCCTKGSVNDDATIYLDGQSICGCRCNIQYKPEGCAVFARKGMVAYIGGSSPYDAWFYPCQEATT